MNASLSLKNALAVSLANQLAGGAMTVYSGTMPATPEDPPPVDAVALVVGLPLADVAASGASVTFSCTQTQISETGVAAWGRIAGAAATHCDITVGGPASGADLELTDTELYQGGFLTITAAEILVQ